MNITICDYNSERANNLKELLQEQITKRKFVGIIKIFDSGLNLIDDITGYGNHDICLIQMDQPGLSGIEIINEIRHYRQNLICVLYSNNLKDALLAWEKDLFGYYFEPFTEENAESLLVKYSKAIEIIDNKYLRLKMKDGWYHICFRNILYIESKAHKVVISMLHTIYENQTVKQEIEQIEAYGKLDNFEIEMEQAKRFIRIHKSVLVNGNHICRFSSSEVEMDDGTIFSVSRALQSKSKEQYDQYMSMIDCITIE